MHALVTHSSNLPLSRHPGIWWEAASWHSSLVALAPSCVCLSSPQPHHRETRRAESPKELCDEWSDLHNRATVTLSFHQRELTHCGALRPLKSHTDTQTDIWIGVDALTLTTKQQQNSSILNNTEHLNALLKNSDKVSKQYEGCCSYWWEFCLFLWATSFGSAHLFWLLNSFKRPIGILPLLTVLIRQNIAPLWPITSMYALCTYITWIIEWLRLIWLHLVLKYKI